MQAYRTLDSWIRRWTVPDEAQRIDPAETAGACVTLRLGGRIIGRGVTMSENGEAIWLAAKQAWIEANQRSPVERDATRRERLREQATMVAIDLQVAGALTPIGAETRDAAAAAIAPGLHGAAARLGARLEAVFPAQSLSGNLSPRQTLDGAIGLLDLPPLPLADLRAQHDLRIYRFGAQHLAQVRADRAPVFLFRGDRVRALTDVRPGALRDLGGAIAAHLEERLWPGEEPLGLLGVYKPWVDEYEEPLVAAPREQALAAYALARWSTTPGASSSGAAQARRTALGVLQDLAIVDDNEPASSDDPAAAALVNLTLIELGAVDDETVRALNAQCAAALRAWAASDAASDAPPALRALGATALARRAGDGDAALATSLFRGAMREVSVGSMAAAMPWLGWAEARLAAATDGDVGAAPALRQFRALVWDHQLRASDVGDVAPDLAGGVVFTRGAAALPTWQTLRPIAYLATSLGDPRLTDADERTREMSRLLASLRFLMQLTAGEATMHMFANPSRALGGVRLAAWDQRQSLEASSLGLLTLSETLRSVASFGR